MAVKIEMNMPKSCWVCKIGVASSGSLFCPVLGCVVLDLSDRRYDDCPLKECK